MSNFEKKVFCDLHTCIQGEGKYAGQVNILARTVGCNLKCTWCDTPYASHKPETPIYSVSELLTITNQTGIQNLLLTGGEPLLQQDILNILPHTGRITIETNGTIPIKDKLPDNYFLSISPKLASSGRRAVKPDVLRQLISSSDYQIKFVISDIIHDMPDIRAIQYALGIPDSNIYLMPNARTQAELAVNGREVYDLALSEGLNYSDRLHIRTQGDQRYA